MKSFTRQDIALTIIRMVVGATFIAHGSQKLFMFGVSGVAGMMGHTGIPFPMLSASLLIAAEFGCGILLFLGLFTRLAAIPIIIAMLVALFQVHLKGGFFLPAGFEYVFVLLGALTGLAIAGPGACAFDNVIAKQRDAKSPELRTA